MKCQHRERVDVLPTLADSITKACDAYKDRQEESIGTKYFLLHIPPDLNLHPNPNHKTPLETTIRPSTQEHP